jgi:DNA polymerase V
VLSTNLSASLLAVCVADVSARQELSLYLETAACGFPSPAEDFIECKLDLNDYLIRHPAATFYVRASGDSMREAGIHSGDLLIVDRAVEPTPGRVVVAVVDGEFTVKRLKKINGKLCLVPDNDAFQPMLLGDGEGVTIWGVVTAVVHKP